MRESLRPSDWRFIGICLALCLASGFVAWRGFSRAFPEASIDFQVNRRSSEGLAEAFLDSLGQDVASWKHAGLFTYDNTAKVFLERQLGPEGAAEVMSHPVGLWRWRHRWFRPQQKEEFRVDVTPSGAIARYEHLLPEEAPGDSLSEEQAKGIAETFLRGRALFEPGSQVFVEGSSERRPHRIDHTFTWKRADFEVEGGTLRVRVQVAGSRIAAFEQFLDVPDSWEHGYQLLRSRNETANIVAAALLLLTGMAMLVVLVLRVRDRDVRWSTATGFAAVAFFLQLLATLNSFGIERFYYPTEDAYSSYVAWQLVMAVLSAFASAGLIFLLTAAAEPVYRERYPEKLSLSHIFTWAGLGTRSFLRQMHLGVSLAFVFVAYQTVFYLVAERLGAWAPLDVPYSNMLNTAFPWALVLLGGFFPAVSEEFVSRMFTLPFLGGLAERGFLGKRYGTWLAVVVSAGIWGFAHAGYPNQPFYIRGVEVGMAGVVVAIIMLRWGILATLVWHYSIDACYTALLLLRSGDSYLQWSGGAAAAVMLLPLGLAWTRAALRGGFEPETGLRNADEPGPRRSSTPLPEPEQEPWKAPRASRKRLWIGAAVAAVLLLLRGVPVERPGSGSALQLDRQGARAQGEAWARHLDLELAGFEEARALVSRFDAATGRYVLQEADLQTLNALYRDPLHTPVWLVRYYHPQVQEEIRLQLPASSGQPVDSTGTLLCLAGFHHVLPDSASGASLTLEAARQVAEAFLRRQGYDPERLHLVESRTSEKESRRDHTFEWEDPSRAIGEAKPRITVVVQGDRIGSLEGRMHLPEAWTRADDEHKAINRLAWVASRGLLGLGLLLVALVFLREVRARHFPWRRALLGGAAVGSISLVPLALGWEARVAENYLATTPWGLFRIIAISAAGVRLLLYGLVAAIVIGTVLSVRRSARMLLEGRWDPASRRDGMLLALIGIVTWVGLKHAVDWVHVHGPGHAQVGDLFMISEAASAWPWLNGYAQLLQNGLLLLPLLALLVHVGRFWLGRWRFFALLALAVLLFAAGAARNLPDFANAAFATGLQLGGLVWLGAFVFRGNDLAFVLAYVAGVGFMHAIQWLQQPLRSLQISGAILALLVTATLAVLLGKGSPGNGTERKGTLAP